MKRKTKVTATQVIKAIEGSGGIKTTIAETLDVSRTTLDKYLDRWATVREAYDAEREKIGDKAESIINTNIELLRQKQLENNEVVDTGDVKWYLSRIRKDYGDKIEITRAISDEEADEVLQKLTEAINSVQEKEETT